MSREKPTSQKIQTGFAHLLLLILIIIIASGLFGVFYYGKHYISQKLAKSSQTIGKPRRSKPPTIIQAVATTLQIDQMTGLPIKPDNQFSQTAQTIYLAMQLNNALPQTKFEYVRYLNGKYLDYGSITLPHGNVPAVDFDWQLKFGAKHRKGQYKVKTYTNGKLEKVTMYTIS